MNPEMKIRKQFVFSGRVQGVGFRYRAVKAAAVYNCTGWVRNEYDGSVSLEIQGTEEQIRQVIHHIEQGRYVRIDSADCYDLPVDENETGFWAE